MPTIRNQSPVISLNLDMGASTQSQKQYRIKEETAGFIADFYYTGGY
jgi:hypothetical protein